MRIKSGDLLYTLKSVARWCKVDASNITFNIAGCIFLILMIEAGLGSYPGFQRTEVVDLVDINIEFQSGRTTGYSNLGG